MPSGSASLAHGAMTLAGSGQQILVVPSAKILTLRDALINDINTNIRRRSPTDFTARKAYAVVDVELLQVSVLPTDLTEEQEDRGSDAELYQLSVVVRKKIIDAIGSETQWQSAESIAECDALLSLAKLIADRYILNTDMSQLSAELANVGQVVLVEKQWFPIYNRFLMDHTGYFHSEVILIFREWVDR